MTEHYRFLEEMYLKAPINEVFKPTIHIEERKCTITMLIDTQFHHAAHALHGSVLFKMLDDAAFFASNSVVEEHFVLTGTFKIRYHKPVSKGELTAYGSADELKDNKVMASSYVLDENGDKIASGSGIFVISSIKLSELH